MAQEVEVFVKETERLRREVDNLVCSASPNTSKYHVSTGLVNSEYSSMARMVVDGYIPAQLDTYFQKCEFIAVSNFDYKFLNAMSKQVNTMARVDRYSKAFKELCLLIAKVIKDYNRSI